jgi:hypothetical protein
VGFACGIWEALEMAFGNGYGGYGGYGVSPYGPIAGSNPVASPYYYPGMAPGKDEFVGLGGKHKKKGLEGFFQGIYNGAANMIKGIFSVQGLAMTAATAGLVWATGGAALIPLAALGGGIGGFQMLKGIAQGNAEGVGEGVFTAGASLLGLRFTPKAVNLNGKAFTLGESGQPLGLTGRLKALWGGEKFKSADGESLSVWQMGLSKLKGRFQPQSAQGTAGHVDVFNPDTWKSAKDVEKLPTVNLKQKEFRQKYWEAHQKSQEPIAATKDGKLGGDFKEVTAKHKAEAELKLLEDQAKFPKQKTVNQFQKADDALQQEIAGLRSEKWVKKHYASQSELSFIEQQIKNKEALRVQLLEDFKVKVDRSAKSREAYILDTNFNPGRAEKPLDWKPQVKTSGDPLTAENLTRHNNSQASIASSEGSLTPSEIAAWKKKND